MDDEGLTQEKREIARLLKDLKKSEAAYDALEEELSEAKGEVADQRSRAKSWENSYRDHGRICDRRYADLELQMVALKRDIDNVDILADLEKARAENAELSEKLAYTEEARREATTAFRELRFGGQFGNDPIGELIAVREKLGADSRAVSSYARRGLEQCQDKIDRIIVLLKHQGAAA